MSNKQMWDKLIHKIKNKVSALETTRNLPVA